jgi:hypothetical protein
VERSGSKFFFVVFTAAREARACAQCPEPVRRHVVWSRRNRIYKTEDSIVDGRRWTPREDSGLTETARRRSILRKEGAFVIQPLQVAADSLWKKSKVGVGDGSDPDAVRWTGPGRPVRGRQGALCARRLACFRFWRTQKPAEPSWHLAAGSTPPPVPGADQRARGLNRIWDGGGRTFSQGGWCRSQLHRARPTYSGRKSILGQK